MRLPDQVQVFLVPLLCLGLVAGAWWLLRGDAEPEAVPVPTVRVLCDEAFRIALVELAEAFERRGRGGVEIRYLPAGELPAAVDVGPWDLVVVGPEIAQEASVREATLPFVQDAEDLGDDPGAGGPQVLLGRGAPGAADDGGVAAAFARFVTGPVGREVFLKYRMLE